MIYKYFLEFINLSNKERFKVFLFSLANPFSTLFSYAIAHMVTKLFFKDWISASGFLFTFSLWLLLSTGTYLFLLKIKFKSFKKQTSNENFGFFLAIIQRAQLVYVPYFLFWFYIWCNVIISFIYVLKDPSLGGALGLGAFLMVILLLLAISVAPIFILISYVYYRYLVKKINIAK
jgi:hypothetical protein